MTDTALLEQIRRLEARVEELESIITMMPGHIYWLDQNNVYQGCNLEQAHSARLSSPREIIGKTNNDMIWKDQANALDAVNRKIIETGEKIVKEETAFMSNKIGIYLSQKVPIYNSQGKITGVLGVSVDITERKRMEQDLQIAKDKAEFANQVKTEFMRNIEHDIRTPLCGIIGVSSYLKTKVENPYQGLLEDIETASNELLDYFNTIYEFSQIDPSIDQLEISQFSITELLSSIQKIEIPAAINKELTLTLEPHLGSADIISDKFKIYRVLLNLVSNAIKFTDEGSITITSKIIETDAENAKLEVKIKDTGIGIALKNQTIIFDKFTRGDLSNRGIYKGTGLGLWVVKQFVMQLDGTVEVISEINQGSTFIISIPIKLAL